MKFIVTLAALASASAFAPQPFGARTATAVFNNFGEYDNKMWDNDAKKDIYGKWAPATARSPMNFNPFETFEGNSPDCSGRYPGEPFYKDPARGDVSYQIMMDERKEAEARVAAPKAGDTPGCPGCRN